MRTFCTLLDSKDGMFTQVPNFLLNVWADHCDAEHLFWQCKHFKDVRDPFVKQLEGIRAKASGERRMPRSRP